MGVILAMILIRKLLVKPADLEPRISMEEDNTYVAQFVVINPALEARRFHKYHRNRISSLSFHASGATAR